MRDKNFFDYATAANQAGISRDEFVAGYQLGSAMKIDKLLL
jgi:hypothetical protein